MTTKKTSKRSFKVKNLAPYWQGTYKPAPMTQTEMKRLLGNKDIHVVKRWLEVWESDSPSGKILCSREYEHVILRLYKPDGTQFIVADVLPVLTEEDEQRQRESIWS